MTWHDYRSNAHFVIYAQGVLPNGTLGGTSGVNEPKLDNRLWLEQNYPNPFKDILTVEFTERICASME